MTAGSRYAQVIAVTFEEIEHGLYVTRCDKLPGLALAGPDRTALVRSIPRAIEMLYEHSGLSVTVIPVEPEDDLPQNWVAVPQLRDGDDASA